jgi:hypothetical protein
MSPFTERNGLGGMGTQIQHFFFDSGGHLSGRDPLA